VVSAPHANRQFIHTLDLGQWIRQDGFVATYYPTRDQLNFEHVVDNPQSQPSLRGKPFLVSSTINDFERVAIVKQLHYQREVSSLERNAHPRVLSAAKVRCLDYSKNSMLFLSPL
jgi:hypothetical protein